MSSIYLILALVFSLIIAIVALANNDTVTVSYLFGRVDLSLILLILGSACSGALVMGLFSLFRSIKIAFALREIRHLKEDLEKKLKNLEEEKLFLEAELNRCSSVPDSSEESSAEAEEEPPSAQEAHPGDLSEPLPGDEQE